MPVVVWTLQRTGGTSLASALTKLFPNPTIEHEPFNKGRIWSRLLAGDSPCEEQVRSALPSLLAERPLIKHCCELHPLWVSRALLDTTVRVGYKHVILIRFSEEDRMKSLIFATKTSIYGRESRLHLNDSDILSTLRQSRSPDVDGEVRRSRESVAAIRKVKLLLTGKGIEHFVVGFEDLYLGGAPIMSNPYFLSLLEYIEAPPDSITENASFLERRMHGNAQGTKHLYSELSEVRNSARLFGSRTILDVGLFPRLVAGQSAEESGTASDRSTLRG